MNTSYGINTYQAHDLNISMRTSSGDTIKMDFANHNSSSMTRKESENGTQTSATFSSMQSFQFTVDSNGIDKQDQKEIDAYMKIAQPYIDSFLKEFEDVAPGSPVSKVAHDIASAFEPSKPRDENGKNNIKTNIVEMFDRSMQELKVPDKFSTEDLLEKIAADTQKLLEKTLEAFEDFNKKLYA